MSFPKRVKVGSYSISLQHRDVLGSDYGETELRKAEISIHPGQELAVEQDTVLHEILHVCYKSTPLHKILDSKIGDSLDTEEVVVASLTPFVLSVIKNNPTLLAYLTA